MKKILTLLTLSTALLFAGTSKVDEKTGLIWQDNSDVGQKDFNYNEALTYCKNLKVDNFSYWRLPSLKEVYSIIDLTTSRPALKKGFEVLDDGRYWTATLFAKNPEKSAWYISLNYGVAEAYNKSRIYHVRCVRDVSKK